MWLAWAAYWWLSARDVKPTQSHESALSRLSYIAPLLIAVFLIFAPRRSIPALSVPFLATTPVSFIVAAALTAAGLLFSVWARLHLGRNWSGTVTIKQDHELITTGPYALVRHPIYSGLVLAFVGSAIALGEWRGVLAVVILLLSFVHKLRVEEEWMRRHFGDAYRAYCARVPALIPFII